MKHFQVEELDNYFVIKLVDKKILCENQIDSLGKELFEFAGVSGNKDIIIDFGNVDYLSSASLGKFMTFHIKTGERMIMFNIHPEIMEVLEITKLNKLFNLAKDKEAALESL